MNISPTAQPVQERTQKLLGTFILFFICRNKSINDVLVQKHKIKKAKKNCFLFLKSNEHLCIMELIVVIQYNWFNKLIALKVSIKKRRHCLKITNID